MRIDVDILLKATQRLLEHLRETGQGTIEISEDFYWDVPADKKYDAYEQPQDLTVGQLSDDWKEVRAIAEGEREAVGYACVWLGSVLRRVGERTA